jgi:sugar phosphate isomerase/epimerase
MLMSIVSGLDESRSTKESVIKKFSAQCHLLKSLDYDGIELSLLEPEKIDIRQIEEVIDSYQIRIPALGTGGTYIRFGYSLGDNDEVYREKAIDRIYKYIDFASEIKSKVIIGLIRGRYKHDSSLKKEKSNIISSLKRCITFAEDSGVELLFEPINRFEMDSYNTISESIELIEEIGSKNLTLLIDSFHIYLEEDPIFIWDELKSICNKVGHIHLADTTRRAPGSGHFDFKGFLNIFKKAGYNQFVSIETIMKPSFEEVAKSSSEYLKLILN